MFSAGRHRSIRRGGLRGAGRLVTAGVLLVSSFLLFAPQALAGPFITLGFNLTSAAKSGACTNNKQAWDVVGSVDVFNGSSHSAAVTIDTRSFPVGFSRDFNDLNAPDADVVSDGGFASGLSVPNDDATHTYNVHLTATIPCDADTGNVSVEATIDGTSEVFDATPVAWNTGAPPQIELSVTSFPGWNSIQWGSCTGGMRHWKVFPIVEVFNDSDSTPAALSATNILVRYTNAAGRTREADATVTDDGGFAPGATIDPVDFHDYNVALEVDLPCDKDPGEAWVVAQARVGDGSLRVSGHDHGNIFFGDDFTLARLDFGNTSFAQQPTSTACTGGQRTWDLFPTYNLVNDSFGPQTITVGSNDYDVTYDDQNFANHTVSDVTVLDDGGLHSGLVLARGDGIHVASHVQVVLPCGPDPQDADLLLAVNSDLADPAQSDISFLGFTTGVPLGTIGMAALALLLALLFGLVQLRSRRRGTSR